MQIISMAFSLLLFCWRKRWRKGKETFLFPYGGFCAQDQVYGLLRPDMSAIYLLGQVMYAMLKLQSSSLHVFGERRCYFVDDINRQTQALCSFSYNRKTSDVHYDSGELRPKTVLGFNEYELLRIFVIYIDEILEPTRSLCRELTIRNIEEHFRRSCLKVEVKFITFLVKLQFVIHPIITCISNKSITSRPFTGSMIYPINQSIVILIE